MPLYVGTSGWQYDDWRGVLYAPGTPRRLWLEEYAQRFATVENNNAFYRLPTAETFAAWRERTPEGFVMAVKASRYLTHIKRLHDPQEPVQRLLSAAEGWARGSDRSCSSSRPPCGRTLTSSTAAWAASRPG